MQTATLAPPPSAWFHTPSKTFLVSQIIVVEWNAPGRSSNAPGRSSEVYKTKVFLSHGLQVDIFGEHRAFFAKDCYGLTPFFENHNFSRQMCFKS